ncbi:VRR-NUC domain-containing protein [Phenylobacterium soli]|uniref:VRR-NUC domain-containing protein n=1 Tax=Phenylobacterium soli TaxID=2170551 RepID=A0A328AAM2_9CAUL|nr:VRR-NUC domain-containing protein [Phenylobacterium soli]RAK51609.1 VRR-NUC domain-containing protein [Phenylobacterium soli]
MTHEILSSPLKALCEQAEREKKTRRRPEQDLQLAVARYIDRAYPGLIWWHTPNASGNRGARLGGILKAMGVKAGVPDIVIILPTGQAAFIELKAGKGRLSEPQEAFRDKVRSFACLWAECRSLVEVEGTLEAWLRPLGHHPKARIAA